MAQSKAQLRRLCCQRVPDESSGSAPCDQRQLEMGQLAILQLRPTSRATLLSHTHDDHHGFPNSRCSLESCCRLGLRPGPERRSSADQVRSLQSIGNRLNAKDTRGGSGLWNLEPIDVEFRLLSYCSVRWLSGCALSSLECSSRSYFGPILTLVFCLQCQCLQD